MAGLDWLTARPIAHRGLHDMAAGVVENTASAVRRAIEGNFAVEVDLQVSADGEALVFHDETLDRLTLQQGRIDALTAAALMQAPFRQTSDRMMRLGDLCDLIAGRVTLLLELKSLHKGDRRLPRRVADVLRGYAGPVAAMSFDPDQMCAMRAAAPKVPCGLTAGGWRPGEHRQALAAGGRSRGGYVRDTVRMRPQFVAYAVQELPSALPLLARYVLGMPLLAWTVCADADWARAARWADQIIFEGFRP